MTEEPSYILDVQGMPRAESPQADSGMAGTEGGAGQARAWIGIHFECCGVYTRIYRNQQATSYEGQCPRCHRPVHIRVGASGTHHRLFRAM